MNTPARLNFHEGSIVVPPGYEDRTTNVFVPANPQKTPNLSIARDTLREGEALPAYVKRQLAELKARIPGYKLIHQGNALLGVGSSAQIGHAIEASYKSGAQLIYQRQAAFLAPTPDFPRRVIVFSATSPQPFDAAFDALWRDWLAAFTPSSTSPTAAE